MALTRRARCGRSFASILYRQVVSERSQMPKREPVPDLSHFERACEEAFAFLLALGFRRVPPPPHRSNEWFQVRYSNGAFSVVASGESYGSAASVHFETRDRRAAEIHFTPNELRPGRPRNRVAEPSQIDQIRQAAARVQAHC